MAKSTAYIFTSNNVRSDSDPAKLAEYRRWKNALIDPDLSSVKGVPRQYWKRRGDEIIPMSAAERAVRDSEHLSQGVDNTPRALGRQRPSLRTLIKTSLKPVLWMGLGALTFHLVGVLLANY